MIKFFGLLSKKKKVDPKLTASIYVAALNNVVDEGFVEIKDFINDNNSYFIFIFYLYFLSFFQLLVSHIHKNMFIF